MEIYNKLVRDNIPDIIKAKGKIPVTRILDNEEYKEELNKKLQEEVKEYIESEDVLEIADIEEVLKALIKLKGISEEEFESIRKEKAFKRGEFNNKIFLERVDNES